MARGGKAPGGPCKADNNLVYSFMYIFNLVNFKSLRLNSNFPRPQTEVQRQVVSVKGIMLGKHGKVLIFI